MSSNPRQSDQNVINAQVQQALDRLEQLTAHQNRQFSTRLAALERRDRSQNAGNNAGGSSGSGSSSAVNSTRTPVSVQPSGLSRSTRDPLETVIAEASQSRLSDVLLAILRQNTQAKKQASSMLLGLQAPASTSTAAAPVAPKRKAPEADKFVWRCKRCPLERTDGSKPRADCLYHPGTKKVNHSSDFWADHDEDCHGRLETLLNDPTYQVGMIWSCCDAYGGDLGCQYREHQLSKYVDKRARR